MIKIIAAIGLDRCIGIKGKNPQLPWSQKDAKGDLSRFNQETSGGIVIMGRRTWDSIGRKPLKNRTNYVIANRRVNAASQECAPYGIFTNLKQAIGCAKRNTKNIFLIGGERIFRDGQKFADEIDLTLIPYKGYENYHIDDLVYFPHINTKIFKKRVSLTHPNSEKLRILKYRK